MLHRLPETLGSSMSLDKFMWDRKILRGIDEVNSVLTYTDFQHFPRFMYLFFSHSVVYLFIYLFIDI